MTEKHLHIVTHDVPWPADYGGVMDLFYKIKSLHQCGISISLHCFVNKRPPREELRRYCREVYYYNRVTNLSRFSLRVPFIVNSRRDEALLANLNRDDSPILL